MEMEDHQYGMADLRQFMSGRPHFPVIQPPPTSELFSGHRSLNSGQHLEMMMVGRQVSDLIPRGLHEFRVDSAATSANTNNIAPSPVMFSGLEAETGCLGGDGGTGRWPRQETLTLLEIRSRLDPKFKEANQKGPLWDEVSRIMSEEHGYQRSGKKCREKFENLYKYYKKTKEGKAGRQDGKHYRFFRQLEALCGETSNPVLSVPETHLLPNNLCFHSATNTSTQANQDAYMHAAQKHSDSLSLSNSSEFDTNSSDDNNLSTNDSIEKRRKRRGGRGWKAKIKDFIDSQMRKLMEKQEAWLEKMMKTLEQKEQERLLREEEWRKEEAARIDREHKFWAKERAWIEARDASLMEALHKLTGRELKRASSPPPPDDQEDVTAAVIRIRNQSENQMEDQKSASWAESEITRLIQVRASMETSGCSEEAMWEEVAAKMACLGYDRSALMCRNKWSSIKNYLRKAKECNKKRKENSRSSCYFQNNDQLSLYNQTNAYNCDVSSPSNSNASNAVNESCFRFLMGDGENLWENYGLNLNKGEN